MTTVLISRLRLCAFLAVASTALTSCFGGGNPIVGKWSLAPQNPDGCPESLQFTGSSMSMTADGGTQSHDVTYKTDGPNVDVSASDNYAMSATVNGNNLTVTQPVQCTYTRS